MNDAIKKAKIFRNRLKKCMDAENYTQQDLAQKLNDTYGTKYTHNDVGRWLKTGKDGQKITMKNKTGTVQFPKFETVILLAEFFDVDIAYLIGETDYKKVSEEQICEYMGLSPKSVYSIRTLAWADTKELPRWNPYVRIALNKLFESDEFKELIIRLNDLYGRCAEPNTIIEEFPCVEEAEHYIDQCNDDILLERYKSNESFLRLLDRLYPYYTIEDTTINDPTLCD